ncbi:MAG TPA: MFS transporter [Humisphaera sp.]|jgi:MFS family permease|nr:MFS transporter [Humisphaera sp.]
MSTATSDTGSTATPLTDEPAKSDKISPDQWRSAAAAWLGWMFDGLDMHLYSLVAAPFVAALLHSIATDPQVKEKSSWIQAAFLVGWALGGGFFGRLGDRLGRSKCLALTVLTYAVFTGLSFFAQSWQQLLVFRFLSALGIGGEWAVGSSLLSETWPARYRPWAAATLQTGVNIGVIFACLSAWVLSMIVPQHVDRAVFLVGVAPALLVFWIRKSVPEPHEWVAAKKVATQMTHSGARSPRMIDLFRGDVRRITILTIIVCACALTAWWAFMFWSLQHLPNLPDLATWTDVQRKQLVYWSFIGVIGVSIFGNYFAALVAKWIGYRRGIAFMNLGFFAAMFGAYRVPHAHQAMLAWMACVGFFSGVFGLFTMYLPPLFPTLLRTTGAGFSYNIGRIFAAFGTVFFGLFAHVGDFRLALLYNSFLLLPAAGVALLLPDLSDKSSTATVPAETAH